MNNKNNIEDILYGESLHCDAFIYKNIPFKFLEEMNNLYCKGAYDIDTVYDFALDAYNYYKKNGIINDAKRMSLMSTFHMMLNEYNNVYEDAEEV